jgi:hypothetical protein
MKSCSNKKAKTALSEVKNLPADLLSDMVNYDQNQNNQLK